MDIVESVRKSIATWLRGGELECRGTLIPLHDDPGSLDVLTTAYNTLLVSTLTTWPQKHTLSPTQFVDFVQSIFNALPSSSSSQRSSIMTSFGDNLVDLIWSVDAVLDEIVGDTKPTAATDSTSGEAMSKTQSLKKNAEVDKEKLQDIVKRLLDCRIISPETCRERLDLTLLAGVGLIVDASATYKKEIRTRTGLFYKQNKFNLLREQSEGYSKLVVEITSGMGPPHSPATGSSTETVSELLARARPIWTKITSLIGYFDLDPNRALDVVLDVLSCNLATHYTFFLILLSLSPWSGAYKRPPTPQEGEAESVNEAPSMDIDSTPAIYKDKSFDEVLTIAEERTPNGGNINDPNSTRVLSQVLGFKFAYYQNPDLSGCTPKSLYLTAAILIREKFTSLEDLYPHLTPTDEDMELTHKEYLEDVKSRIAGAKISQLAMAAPLESSSSSQPKAKPAPVEETKKLELKQTNQKIGLLHALLSVGALRPAFAILSKFPWVVDACPEIADLLLRVLKHSIQPLYESMLVTKTRNPNFTKPRPRYGPSGVVQPSARKPLLTLWAPIPPSTITTDFVFFYPDWAERVPVSNTLDDLQDVIEPIMHFIGVHVSRDPLFLAKFLRLGRSQLVPTNPPLDPQTRRPIGKADPDHPIRKFWFKVLRKYLIPALPLIRGNAVCTVEIWNIVRHFPMEARWQLYGEWKSTVYQSHPELRVRQVQADRESKGILRRLSHNTIDTLSGTVAKLAHSNPCIFFATAVNQIMAYDNLAGVVIQALRYVTNMGFDVLVFMILDALANPNKERVKDDGVNTADWLQSLASFTGMLFRRYSAELSPVLHYIAHQLHNGQTTEIVVLRELIWKMAGIEPLPSLSESQIAAMAGGPILRIEAIASVTRGSKLDPSESVFKGPQRLGRSLLEPPSLALPLLVQVAQQRQACVFKASDAHLKSLASLFDATHGVLLQYLELLTWPLAVPPEVYAAKILPSLSDLGEKYGIGAPICMQIFRPVWHAALLKPALALSEQERSASEEAEKRLKAALTAKREPSSSSRVASPSLATSSTPEATDVKPSTEPAPMEGVTTEGEEVKPVRSPESPWLPELLQHFEDVKKIAPGNAFDIIGPGFYLTFWQLSMYDLAPPIAKYAEIGGTLRQMSRQEDSKYIAADRSADRARRLTATAHRQRRDRYTTYVHLLAEELKEQSASRSFTIKRLAREKLHWFAHVSKAALLVTSIIEHCIQPRCPLSPMDADFCAQFIKVLHTMGTPGFHTLALYDKLLGDHVKVVLFSCSEYEARNYGRFLGGILTDTLSWFKSKQLYEQDNQTTRNGQVMYHPGFQRSWNNKPAAQEDVLKHENLITVVRKWHRKLGKSFMECIRTEEYMHVYNAIIVLKEILPVFPLAIVSDVGPGIDAAIDRLLEKEERGDLKILGKAYSASLKKRESLWTVPKSTPKKQVNGAVPVKPASQTPQPIPEKPRNAPPTAPHAQNGSPMPSRPIPAHVPSAPSGPRSHTQSAQPSAVPAPDKLPESTSTNKIPIENIPRPEVVRRVRPEVNKDSPRPSPVPSAPAKDAPPTDSRNSSAPVRNGDTLPIPVGPITGGRRSPAVYPDISRSRDSHLLAQHRDMQEPPRNMRPTEEKPRVEPPTAVAMPPPIAPSQTASAQELRESARQTLPRLERTDSQGPSGSAAPSPRHRSPSPSSRPGTRPPSNDSRASGGRGRSDDNRRNERETRPDREHGSSVARRDSLTHTRNERSGRDRARERDGDREERERERDRPRERDRHSDRERDKERDRERDRERERDRDRDRHRRDDKERERDRKESRTQLSSTNTPVLSDDRGLPSRPDVSRHRNGPISADDALGKRRRPTDDESDRASKRSSRKESHREERSRRPPEKEERGRESERKRKEREGHEGESRPSLPEKPTPEKPAEKKIPEGPAKAPPAGAPSAPRAMAGSERSTRSDPNSGRDRHRDGGGREQPPQQQKGPPPNTPTAPDASRSANSLRSRISEKEGLSHSPAPASGSSYRLEAPSMLRREDERDSRKRTASERDKDVHEAPVGPNDPSAQAPKRPRINRNRYGQPSGGGSGNAHGLARKLLPIDPSAGDKNRGRQD